MKHQPYTASEAALYTAEAVRHVDANYGWPFKEKKMAFAEIAATKTMEFYNDMPIGWNYGDSIDTVYANAKEHVKGFLPAIGLGFILYFAFAAIIEWVVTFILDKKFKRNS